MLGFHTHRRVLVSAALLLTLAGCREAPPSRTTPEEGVTLGDLAPPPQSDDPALWVGSLTLDVHIYNVPVGHRDALRGLWAPLLTRGLLYRNHYAFRANGLRIGRTRMARWNWVVATLEEARAQRERSVSLLVDEQTPTDLVIRRIPDAPLIDLVNVEQQADTARLRPGNFCLRLWARREARGYRLIGNPALALTISQRIPELAERMREHEINFQAAAFSCPMVPGDVLILGPEEHVGDESSLGGLLFRNPQGILFMDPFQPKLPKWEPTLRVFVLTCTGIREPGS